MATLTPDFSLNPAGYVSYGKLAFFCAAQQQVQTLKCCLLIPVDICELGVGLLFEKCLHGKFQK